MFKNEEKEKSLKGKRLHIMLVLIISLLVLPIMMTLTPNAYNRSNQEIHSR